MTIQTKWVCAAALSASCMFFAFTANAAEFVQTTRPRGVRDIRAAELPPVPGLYAGFGVVRSDKGKLTDGNGDSVFPDSSSQVRLVRALLMYVLPSTVLGGRVAATAGLAAGRNDIKITGPIAGSPSGLYDLTLGLAWSLAFYTPPKGPPTGPPAGTAFGAGLSWTLPTGTYATDRVGNPGFNTYTISPHLALTHRTQPWALDGTEFSVHASYNYAAVRPDASGGFDYQDGAYIIADFAVTERYRRFQFGLAGSYQNQIEADSGSPEVPAGARGRLKGLALGPFLAVGLGRGKTLSVKYLADIETADSFEGQVLSVGFFTNLF